jgi:hypothetical protein
MAPFEVIKKLCAKGWVSFEAEWWLPKTATARQNFYKKETIEEFMARTATTKDTPVELDVIQSQSWPQVDFLNDNPFA